MDFEEFLWAKGYSDQIITELLEHMLSGIAFSETEKNIFSNLFLEYCILGRMPAIVNESKYKVYIADTGLLVANLDDEAQTDLRANKNLGVYKGAQSR